MTEGLMNGHLRFFRDYAVNPYIFKGLKSTFCSMALSLDTCNM